MSLVTHRVDRRPEVRYRRANAHETGGSMPRRDAAWMLSIAALIALAPCGGDSEPAGNASPGALPTPVRIQAEADVALADPCVSGAGPRARRVRATGWTALSDRDARSLDPEAWALHARLPKSRTAGSRECSRHSALS